MENSGICFIVAQYDGAEDEDRKGGRTTLKQYAIHILLTL